MDKNKNETWIIEFTDTDHEPWTIDYEGYMTKEEAIQDGIEIAKKVDQSSFRVGRIIPYSIADLDVDVILEHAIDQARNVLGEYEEDYLSYVTTQQAIELEKELNEVFYRWHKKYDLFLQNFIVEESEFVEVK